MNKSEVMFSVLLTVSSTHSRNNRWRAARVFSLAPSAAAEEGTERWRSTMQLVYAHQLTVHIEYYSHQTKSQQPCHERSFIYEPRTSHELITSNSQSKARIVALLSLIFCSPTRSYAFAQRRECLRLKEEEMQSIVAIRLIALNYILINVTF